MEALLRQRRPSNYRILHPPCVDFEWNLKDAHRLIQFAVFIMSQVEEYKYEMLRDYLKKKDTYLETLKVLDKLMEEHHFESRNVDFTEEDSIDSIHFGFTKEELMELKRDQTLCHYVYTLEFADKLVALDPIWTDYFDDS